MLPHLAMVDERPELPPDPKVRIYGRYPEFAVAVRLDYIEDPKDMLKELAEFIYKYAGNPNYDEEKKDLWEGIFNAVICTSSYEVQLFRNNLDMLIKDNIQETGFDPRIAGPPEHIAN